MKAAVICVTLVERLTERLGLVDNQCIEFVKAQSAVVDNQSATISKLANDVLSRDQKRYEAAEKFAAEVFDQAAKSQDRKCPPAKAGPSVCDLLKPAIAPSATSRGRTAKQP